MSKEKKTERISTTEGLSYTVRGIPCLVYITSYTYQPSWKGSPQTCDSDLDYYGYEDIEYELYNLRGYRMKFLESKCTPDDIDRIKMFISEQQAQKRAEKDVF